MKNRQLILEKGGAPHLKKLPCCMCSCERDCFGSFRQREDRCSRCIKYDVQKCYCHAIETREVIEAVDIDIQNIEKECSTNYGFDIKEFIEINPVAGKYGKQTIIISPCVILMHYNVFLFFA